MGATAPSVWDKEGATEEALKLLKDGISCSIIADRLTMLYGVRVTRNAVLGKIHRLGMSAGHDAKRVTPRVRKQMGRQKGWRKKPFVRMQPKISKVYEALRAEPEPLPIVDDLVIPIAERKSLIDLEKYDCRWGIGDPRDADFHFCGRKQLVGTPYCPFHARRAYRLPDSTLHRRAAAGRSPVGECREHNSKDSSNPMPVKIMEEA